MLYAIFCSFDNIIYIRSLKFVLLEPLLFLTLNSISKIFMVVYFISHIIIKYFFYRKGKGKKEIQIQLDFNKGKTDLLPDFFYNKKK